MEDKPMLYSEYESLVKEKKLHTKIEQIKKGGILFMPGDFEKFEEEILLDMKNQVKEAFDDFLEEHFPQ